MASADHRNLKLIRYLDEQKKRKQRQASLVRLLMLVVALALIVKVDFGELFANLQLKPQQLATIAPIADAGLQPNTAQCEPSLPPNGSSFLFDPSTIRRSDKVYSGLNLSNQHNFPVVLLISDVDHTANYQAVTIHPGGNTELSLPVGSYGLSMMVGKSWCNVHEGFSGGRRIVVTNPIEILPGHTNQLRFESSGNRDIDIQLVSTQMSPHEPATQQQEPRSLSMIGTAGAIELQRQSNGGFYINGMVNNIPVVFQIDTGASITSIPKETALSAGIYDCIDRTFDTANGQAYGCIGVAKSLTLGNNRIEGFQVAALPNLKNALLGMNILRYFRIEHSGDVMRLSAIRNGNDFDPPPGAPLPNQLMPQITPPPQIRTTEYPQQPSQPSQADMSIQREEVCRKSYESDKEYLNARMRQGYSAQEGELLRERLRQIELAYRTCRNRG